MRLWLEYPDTEITLEDLLKIIEIANVCYDLGPRSGQKWYIQSYYREYDEHDCDHELHICVQVLIGKAIHKIPKYPHWVTTDRIDDGELEIPPQLLP